MKIGFFVNPLAGYGIVTNSKGSDGLVLGSPDDSRSVLRAQRFLEGLKNEEIGYYVPSGIMGSDLLENAGIKSYRIIYEPGSPTSAGDTQRFVQELNRTDASLLVFVGGDGTARDILSQVRDGLQVIGVPGGMKMYSSVFAISLKSAVELVKELVSRGEWDTVMGEVVDIDEEKYRKGILDISLFGEMAVPATPLVISQAKAEYSEVDVSGISDFMQEKMEKGTVYVIGPGSTCKSVLPEGVRKTNVLGFDILVNGVLEVEDADEETIFRYVSHDPSVLVISPIGGQNFLLGRGNKQISPRIVERVGWSNIWVLSSQEKLRTMANLYVDIGNSHDVKAPAFVKVLYGYGRYRMVPVKR